MSLNIKEDPNTWLLIKHILGDGRKRRIPRKGDKGFKGEQICKWVVFVTMCFIFYFVADCMQILLEGKMNQK